MYENYKFLKINLPEFCWQLHLIPAKLSNYYLNIKEQKTIREAKFTVSPKRQ